MWKILISNWNLHFPTGISLFSTGISLFPSGISPFPTGIYTFQVEYHRFQLEFTLSKWNITVSNWKIKITCLLVLPLSPVMAVARYCGRVQNAITNFKYVSGV